MSDTRTFEIIHAGARREIMAAVADAPLGYFVKIMPETRTLQQNAKLHAIFTDISKTEKYIGRELNSVQWKSLFISGHAVATGLGADMVPGLENEYVNIRESSAQMGVARMSSLIEYTLAWQAETVAA